MKGYVAKKIKKIRPLCKKLLIPTLLAPPPPENPGSAPELYMHGVKMGESRIREWSLGSGLFYLTDVTWTLVLVTRYMYSVYLL